LLRMSLCFFFFSSRRRHTRSKRDWSSDVCSSDLTLAIAINRGFQGLWQLLGQESFPLDVFLPEVIVFWRLHPVGVVGESTSLWDNDVHAFNLIELDDVFFIFQVRIGRGSNPVHALLGATSAIEHVDGWTCFIKRSIRGNHRQWNFKVHRWGIGIKTLDALEPVLCTVSVFMAVHAVHPGFLKRNFLARIPVTFHLLFNI